MKYCRFLMAQTSAFSISCKASVPVPVKNEVHCPETVARTQNIPAGSILIGALPESSKKPLSAGLITKSGSKLQEQVWDEETIDFEDGSEGTIAQTALDTSLNDPYLKCSYPGAKDPVKKEYFDVQVLLPIRPHTPGFCKLKKRESEMSASCEYGGLVAGNSASFTARL